MAERWKPENLTTRRSSVDDLFDDLADPEVYDEGDGLSNPLSTGPLTPEATPPPPASDPPLTGAADSLFDDLMDDESDQAIDPVVAAAMARRSGTAGKSGFDDLADEHLPAPPPQPIAPSGRVLGSESEYALGSTSRAARTPVRMGPEVAEAPDPAAIAKAPDAPSPKHDVPDEPSAAGPSGGPQPDHDFDALFDELVGETALPAAPAPASEDEPPAIPVAGSDETGLDAVAVATDMLSGQDPDARDPFDDLFGELSRTDAQLDAEATTAPAPPVRKPKPAKPATPVAASAAEEPEPPKQGRWRRRSKHGDVPDLVDASPPVMTAATAPVYDVAELEQTLNPERGSAGPLIVVRSKNDLRTRSLVPTRRQRASGRLAPLRELWNGPLGWDGHEASEKHVVKGLALRSIVILVPVVLLLAISTLGAGGGLLPVREASFGDRVAEAGWRYGPVAFVSSDRAMTLADGSIVSSTDLRTVEQLWEGLAPTFAAALDGRPELIERIEPWLDPAFVAREASDTVVPLPTIIGATAPDGMPVVAGFPAEAQLWVSGSARSSNNDPAIAACIVAPMEVYLALSDDRLPFGALELRFTQSRRAGWRLATADITQSCSGL